MDLRMESPVGARTVFSGREYDYFGGTGYLGLQSNPRVLQAGLEALQRYGLSTATSRGGYGEHPVYDELEREACAYFGSEKMLYFPSGYMGMSVLAPATGELYEHIFIDSSAHFSLWDAAQATGKPITPFHYRQPQALQEALKRELRPGERPLVVSDGIFPISGDIAPLPDYLALVKLLNGCVYLDDAHALGVLGPNGRGTPDYFGIEDEAVHTCGTLSKGLGGFGGVIWGRKAWIEAVERCSRVCVGASPPPLVAAAASARALQIARTTPALRERLWANVKRMRDGLRACGWPLEDTPSPVVCLGVRDGVSLERIKSGLFEQGFATALVRTYSSTPAGGALRVAVFATHTDEQIDRFIAAVARLI
jgi:8-amino-7-oxononanoate synthase